MAKFHGSIGYAQTVETSPGVHKEITVERECVGDILRNTQRSENDGQKLNDNITLNNQFSIIGDDFAHQNLQRMKFLKWMKIKWKISSIEIQPPRIILTVGGVYNG